MECSKCGATLREGAKFCAKCGAEVPREILCAKCGAALAEGDSFCSACGAPTGLPRDMEDLEILEWSVRETEGETLMWARDGGTGLLGAVNDRKETVIPFLFYDAIDSVERVGQGTRGKWPQCAMTPTKQSERVFINRDLDVEFDRVGQREYYERFPEGREWFRRYRHLLGRVYLGRVGGEERWEALEP